jgi:hypothetical protein
MPHVLGDPLDSIPRLCNIVRHVRQHAMTLIVCDRKLQVVAPLHQRLVE